MNPILLYRISRRLYLLDSKRTAKFIKGVNFLVFHAVIPPELVAGANFTLGHYGLGIVIHPKTKIGDDVFLNHAVTLATDLPPNDSREMTLGSRITIGTGAVLVGPITVGDDVVIGAGAVVVDDVESGVVVAGVPARVVSHNGNVRQHSKRAGS